jgi:hypothetical protein
MSGPSSHQGAAVMTALNGFGTALGDAGEVVTTARDPQAIITTRDQPERAVGTSSTMARLAQAGSPLGRRRSQRLEMVRHDPGRSLRGPLTEGAARSVLRCEVPR